MSAECRTGLPGAKQGEVQPETGGIADASVSKDPGTRGVQAERADQLSNAGFHGSTTRGFGIRESEGTPNGVAQTGARTQQSQRVGTYQE